MPVATLLDSAFRAAARRRADCTPSAPAPFAPATRFVAGRRKAKPVDRRFAGGSPLKSAHWIPTRLQLQDEAQIEQSKESTKCSSGKSGNEIAGSLGPPAVSPESSHRLSRRNCHERRSGGNQTDLPRFPRAIVPALTRAPQSSWLRANLRPDHKRDLNRPGFPWTAIVDSTCRLTTGGVAKASGIEQESVPVTGIATERIAARKSRAWRQPLVPEMPTTAPPCARHLGRPRQIPTTVDILPAMPQFSKYPPTCRGL